MVQDDLESQQYREGQFSAESVEVTLQKDGQPEKEYIPYEELVVDKEANIMRNLDERNQNVAAKSSVDGQTLPANEESHPEIDMEPKMTKEQDVNGKKAYESMGDPVGTQGMEVCHCSALNGVFVKP